ncbi:GNAT family N-acetyltransferase [Natrialbaceae archaeon AArc-T1-2]|uniref:GNAT family N-acetyltransferase n=1 Tax=Natrialbaceae archaeon AArc-T1-2 TaxID=3053904 RepID=UPI00255B2B67|nr:GNAT family N-acetyltransferase [Natrialbaceae archaeon AArc-T1-2]WIV65729.1 GNAT family N-acetyltransferase [Natrialbaceae archaeon AArc-T1-2]
MSLEIRRATHDDYEAVVELTSDVWADRGGDYIPRIYHDWLEDDDEPHRKTLLAEVDGEVAGLVQAVMLSSDEAWFQGMRVAPEHRRVGVSERLNDACFAWARERDATVGRIIVFSWNVAALGAARAGGYEPVTEFRWAYPGPDPDATGPLEVVSDPSVAWRYWTDSDARTRLRGLALDPDESWALRELTRRDLERLAAETAVFAVVGDRGVSGMTYRVRTVEREVDGETETWAEYGVGAWDDLESARTLCAVVSRDAGELAVDGARMLLPETAASVTDAAYVCETVSEEADFVLEVDLTGYTAGRTS